MRDVEIEESDDQSYFIRLLTQKVDRVPVGELRAALAKARLPLKLNLQAGSDSLWEHLTLENRRGPIAAVERLSATGGAATPGGEMIAAFLDSLKGCKPKAAVDWVTRYLAKLAAIYSFEVLDGVEEEHGWDGLYVLQNLLHERLGGIFQSDGEGFSNDQGVHAVWQFDDEAAGPWKMAVLINGRWQPFMMNLEDRAARKAFCEGKVPPPPVTKRK